MSGIVSALRKGPRVVAFRGWQEARILGRTILGGWPRLERAIDRRASRTDTVARWLDLGGEAQRIVPRDHVAALLAFARSEPEWRSRLYDSVEHMRAGSLPLFDSLVPFDRHAIPWQTDWRAKHDFPLRFFKRHRFFGIPKAVPDDVKFPWELSRFGFAVPLALGTVVFSDNRYRDLLLAWIADWRRANPFAFSVNWQPMECAMRGIQVTLAAELLLAAGHFDEEHAGVVLPFLCAQGEFLSRTIERTDINNNHFFANAAGLAVMGASLSRSGYPATKRWMRSGFKWVSAEIPREFYPDGVNFEMAVGYHRLVTELGLLTSIVADRFAAPIASESRTRLRAAWLYSVAYRRPDGLAPNVGDSDGAHALCFDSLMSRDHAAVRSLGAAYFNDEREHSPSASVPVLLGAYAHDDATPSAPLEQWQHFRDGGVVIARTLQKDFIWYDCGPVGLAGRGGHGHNDLFSFELILRGRPVVVDPGCPTYTGDLNLHRRFCGSAMHNGLAIDDVEIAPQLGPWRTANDAVPFDVSATVVDEVLTIRGEHHGYRRLRHPVDHRRTTRFDFHSGSVAVEDSLIGEGTHTASRWLHLATGVRARENSKHCIGLVSGDDEIARLRWDETSTATVLRGQVSEVYGTITDADVIRIDTHFSTGTRLWFSIDACGETSANALAGEAPDRTSRSQLDTE